MHRFKLQVYYEDTDMGGIVYYANYLKFIERARSDWVRTYGIDQAKMREIDGVVFAVRRLEADYVSSAKFDDTLEVETELVQISGARVVLDQQVKRAGKLLFQAQVTLVAIGAQGQAMRIPAELRQQVH